MRVDGEARDLVRDASHRARRPGALGLGRRGLQAAAPRLRRHRAHRGSFGRPAPAAPKVDTGDTAWVLTSSALVLMMTAPGLALFYGGLVRRKNVLATLMQCSSSWRVITVLWVLCGYSLAFGPTIGGLIGSLG